MQAAAEQRGDLHHADSDPVTMIVPDLPIQPVASNLYSGLRGKVRRNSLSGLGQTFPMYVVYVREVMRMTEVKPHQELLQENMLVEYVDGCGNVLIAVWGLGGVLPSPHPTLLGS